VDTVLFQTKPIVPVQVAHAEIETAGRRRGCHNKWSTIVTDGAIVVDPKDIRRLVADEVARAVAPSSMPFRPLHVPIPRTATAEDRILSQEELAEFLGVNVRRFPDLNTRVAFTWTTIGPRTVRWLRSRSSGHGPQESGPSSPGCRHTESAARTAHGPGAAGSEGDAMRPDSWVADWTDADGLRHRTVTVGNKRVAKRGLTRF